MEQIAAGIGTSRRRRLERYKRSQGWVPPDERPFPWTQLKKWIELLVSWYTGNPLPEDADLMAPLTEEEWTEEDKRSLTVFRLKQDRHSISRRRREREKKKKEAEAGGEKAGEKEGDKGAADEKKATGQFNVHMKEGNNSSFNNRNISNRNNNNNDDDDVNKSGENNHVKAKKIHENEEESGLSSLESGIGDSSSTLNGVASTNANFFVNFSKEKPRRSSAESLYTVDMRIDKSGDSDIFLLSETNSESSKASSATSSSKSTETILLKPIAAVQEEQDQQRHDFERIATQRRNERLQHIVIILIYLSIFVAANWLIIHWSHVENVDDYVCQDGAFCHGHGVCYLRLKETGGTVKAFRCFEGYDPDSFCRHRIITDPTFYECTPYNPCYHGDCVQERCCFGERIAVTCVCPRGYVGRFCQHHVCDMTLIMSDGDWIQNWIYVEDEPLQAFFDGKGIPVCFNGGKCLKTNDNDKPYRCHCPAGKKGEWCELDLCFAKGKTHDHPMFCKNNGRCNWEEGGCLCPEGYSGETCELICPAAYIDEKKGKKYCMVGTDYMVPSSIRVKGTENTFCPVRRDGVEYDSRKVCDPWKDKGGMPLRTTATPLVGYISDWLPIWRRKF